jgi:hypothetical protein
VFLSPKQKSPKAARGRPGSFKKTTFPHSTSAVQQQALKGLRKKTFYVPNQQATPQQHRICVKNAPK